MDRHPLGYLNDEDMDIVARLPVAGLCASCKFWKPIELPIYPEVDPPVPLADNVSGFDFVGCCHRFPPSTDPHEDYETAVFPLTEWDSWCGEHVESRKSMPLEEP